MKYILLYFPYNCTLIGTSVHRITRSINLYRRNTYRIPFKRTRSLKTAHQFPQNFTISTDKTTHFLPLRKHPNEAIISARARCSRADRDPRSNDTEAGMYTEASKAEKVSNDARIIGKNPVKPSEETVEHRRAFRRRVSAARIFPRAPIHGFPFPLIGDEKSAGGFEVVPRTGQEARARRCRRKRT